MTMAYLSNNPNFSVLNEALFGALNGNWTGLSYAAFGPAYTQAFVVVLPTVCLDQRRPYLTVFRYQMSRDLMYFLCWQISTIILSQDSTRSGKPSPVMTQQIFSIPKT